MKKELEKSGGIFIETTEKGDWLPGDETRKIERVDDLEEVKERTGLELKVCYDRGSVTVTPDSVFNVEKMILVGNNGEFIRSAESGRCDHLDDLTATYGQHVTIEPFYFIKNKLIRVLVYPKPKAGISPAFLL